MAKFVAVTLALLVMLVGLIGIIVPVLPGTILIALAVLGYGWWEGFQAITPGFVAGVWVAVGAAIAVEKWAAARAAQRAGASRAGTWGSLLGAILGVFALGPAGLLLGPLAGAVLGEMLSGRQPGDALRIGFHSVLGAFKGLFLHLLIALGVVIMFLVKVFGGA